MVCPKIREMSVTLGDFRGLRVQCMVLPLSDRLGPNPCCEPVSQPLCVSWSLKLREEGPCQGRVSESNTTTQECGQRGVARPVDKTLHFSCSHDLLLQMRWGEPELAHVESVVEYINAKQRLRCQHGAYWLVISFVPSRLSSRTQVELSEQVRTRPAKLPAWGWPASAPLYLLSMTASSGITLVLI